jgi:hypothetical protein
MVYWGWRACAYIQVIIYVFVSLCFWECPLLYQNFPNEARLISVITVITVLAAPSAFGNKLRFEYIEVGSVALTDILNDGLDEERTHH